MKITDKGKRLNEKNTELRMKNKRIIEYLVVILLIVVSGAGILSWNTGNSFYAVNQYGEEILMWSEL